MHQVPSTHAAAAEQTRVLVRRPYLKDFPAILDISNWATCHTLSSFRIEPETLEHWVHLWQGKRETYPWYVAEIDGAVVGFAMASPYRDRCGFASTAEVTVYVAPDRLGEGIGRKLYEHLVPTLAAQGFRSLIASITVPNPLSERLHLAFGFRKVGVLERVGWKFRQWHDVAIWQLALRRDEGPPETIRPLVDAVSSTANGIEATTHEDTSPPCSQTGGS